MTKHLLLVFIFFGAISVRGNDFDWRRDTFAFANDTLWAYNVGRDGHLKIEKKETRPTFTRSCFILGRSVIQFHKFAQFDASKRKVSRDEYQRIIRRISRIPAWRKGFAAEDRIVVPGYPDLLSFSNSRSDLLKENLGNWRWTYLRIGNWRMSWPHFRFGQASGARKLTERLDRGDLQAVYLARFPSMNHVVVVFDYKRLGNGDIKFDFYDPNYPGEKGWLLYHENEKSFELQERWYFPQGRVNIMRVYISPFH